MSAPIRPGEGQRPLPVRIEVTREPGADPDLELPTYATAGAAGADLRADLMGGDPIVLGPMARALVPTGLRIALPRGWELQVRPRSGLALTHGITVANAPGTVDSDYRGPLGVILVNLSDTAFEVTHGMRVAQVVVSPVAQSVWDAVPELAASARGTGGFGSTGLD